MRLRDPVYGCMGAISVLQQQIQSLQAQLNALRAEIINYKLRDLVPSSRAVSVAAPPPGPPPLPPPPAPPSLPPSPTYSSSSMLQPHQRTPTIYNTIPNDNTSYFS